ncbi:glyceraldehyde 3-phosphate dehydrogenase NAD-binding domain-containing protein, partial [Shigella flexneri]|uniref:glyceraldehyde 3-phosphate dehydrogenase NAD-binding domain-containing protein n=1 Tax=Shigella flexneri TaxID=623 RepID=UPI0023781FA4
MQPEQRCQATNRGNFRPQIAANHVGINHRFFDNALIVDGKSIAVYAEKEAKNIPWKAKGAEIIVECTGFYTSAD